MTKETDDVSPTMTALELLDFLNDVAVPDGAHVVFKHENVTYLIDQAAMSKGKVILQTGVAK